MKKYTVYYETANSIKTITIEAVNIAKAKKLAQFHKVHTLGYNCKTRVKLNKD